MDPAKAVDPIKHHLGVKASIRRSIEAEGIPYTYLLSNGFAGYFLPNFGIARTGGTGSFTAPPRDKVEIIGDGNTKGININSIIFLFKLVKTFSFAYECACVCEPFTRYKSTRSTTLVKDDQVIVIFYVGSNFFQRRGYCDLYHKSSGRSKNLEQGPSY